MTTFRIDFDWRSAMPGRDVRGNCYRFSTGVCFVHKTGQFSHDDLSMLTRQIAADARRQGMRDVIVRIKEVSHLTRCPVASSATCGGAVVH